MTIETFENARKLIERQNAVRSNVAQLEKMALEGDEVVFFSVAQHPNTVRFTLDAVSASQLLLKFRDAQIKELEALADELQKL